MLFRKPGAGAVDFIIAGLGNPGPSYENTRHNAGFMAIDAIAGAYNITVDRLKWNGLTGTGDIEGSRVLMIKPQTFMNCSGEAVTAAMRFYKIPPERVLVIFDDISLAPGTMRVRFKGSDGGQKGMRSIIELSGSQAFPRIKLGIGDRPNREYDLAKWVLSNFSADDKKLVDDAIKRAVKAAALIVSGRPDEAASAGK